MFIYIECDKKKQAIFCLSRLVSGSKRELSGLKELGPSSRRVQKRGAATGVVRSDGGCIAAGGLLGGCSGGSDALAELTIEDLAAIPTANHTGLNHQPHPSHHKVYNIIIFSNHLLMYVL